ncbi:hypothetical protein BBP40_008143 [Aspergillus hancockii]|nr:hypothetical protein BBP40_008143 [Aspergillus hancockii]
MLRNRTAFQRKKSTVSKAKAANATKCKADSKGPSPALTVSTMTISPTASTTSVVSTPKDENSPVPLDFVGAVSPKLPGGLCLPLETTVTSLFFNSYLYLPRDPLIRIGFLELLPQQYFNSQPGSPLSLGTLAVSLFSASAWTGNRSFLRLAEQFFGKALSKTRMALQGNLGENLVETLMTVLLLSVYEEFSAVKEHRIAAKTHLRGAIALVNSGYIAQYEDANADIITNSIQCQIIKASTVQAYPTVEIPDVWPLAPPIPQSASSQLTAAAAELVELRQVWDNFTSHPELHDTDELNRIYSMAIDLDTKLSAWKWALPPHWAPVRASTIPQSVREAGAYKNRCDCYTEMWIASTWNTYRELRITVQKTILNCLRLLNIDSTENVQSVISTIHTMATDICATVPFFLGSQTMSVQLNPYKVEYPEAEGRRVTMAHQQTAPLLGGWLILSFLENLCSPDICLPDEQRTWVKEQMRRIWRIYTFETRVV